MDIENTPIKTSVKLDGKLMLRVFRVKIILIGAAAIAILAIFVLCVIFPCLRPTEDVYDKIISILPAICCAFLFLTCTTTFIVIIFACKKSDGLYECELQKDYMTVKESHEGEVASAEKIYYASILKSKETDKFFIVDFSKTDFCVVGKQGLAEEQLVAIRKALNVKTRRRYKEVG